MNQINPKALLLIGFGAVVGALCGSVLWGLAVSLGLLLALEVKSAWDSYDPVGDLILRHRRKQRRGY